MGPAVVLVLCLAAPHAANAVSPVQKVVELLEECKAKVAKDLAAEGAEMEKYVTFCDDELQDKGYAIKTADRSIVDLEAKIEDAAAEIAELDKDLTNATMVRTAKHEAFAATEKEMLASID